MVQWRFAGLSSASKDALTISTRPFATLGLAS